MGHSAMLFTGLFRRALDEKQRLAIPKPFREQLQTSVRLYLTPGLDGCLAVYPESSFAALAERLAAGSPASREIRDYCRLFYSQTACVVPDSQWRVRIPAELTHWASLQGEVAMVGVRDHLEVWAPGKWDGYVSQCDPNYDRLAELALLPTQTMLHQTPSNAGIPVEIPVRPR
jgi:MraZ protein